MVPFSSASQEGGPRIFEIGSIDRLTRQALQKPEIIHRYDRS